MALLKRHTCRFLLAVTFSLAAAPCPAASAPATEFEVKAAFLCSFAEFVEWPSLKPGDPVTIAILGDDPFGSLLEATAKSRALQTKPLLMRRVATVRDALDSQIVYVSASERRNLPEILRTLAGTSILTVSDVENFARQGGIIGFTIEQRRVRFEINAEAAERGGLRISSRLLKLARIVGPEVRSGG